MYYFIEENYTIFPESYLEDFDLKGVDIDTLPKVPIKIFDEFFKKLPSELKDDFRVIDNSFLWENNKIILLSKRPSKEHRWSGDKWEIPEKRLKEIIKEKQQINSVIEEFGTIEIIPKEPSGDYFEGWKSVNFNKEFSEVVNVQVTACDIKGKSVFESAVVGEVTNTSMKIGVFSKEKLDEPIKVYWLVKGV